jgi:hypothetical protein
MSGCKSSLDEFRVVKIDNLSTSAYYDTNNQLQVLASIPSSKAWQRYFLETLQDEKNHA